MIMTNEQLFEIYRYILLTRRCDESINEVYKRRGLPELPHSSQGLEAIHVGSVYGLRDDDWVLPSLRSRAYFYVRKVPLKVMMAGMFGKITGPNRGKGTSHHSAHRNHGVLPGSGLVGSSIPWAVGAALALKKQGKDSVVVVAFGEGATSRGDFHESLKLASVWNLPVIFVVENNMVAISTPIEKQMKEKEVAKKAIGYGIPGKIVDGTDVLEVYAHAQEAVARARKGDGPTLLECVAHRWKGHHANDTDFYRDAIQIQKYREDCPLKKFEKYLINERRFDADMLKNVEKEVQQEIEEALKFAEDSPFPDPVEALSDVYA